MQQCLEMYTHYRFVVKTFGDSKDFSNLRTPDVCHGEEELFVEQCMQFSFSKRSL